MRPQHLPGVLPPLRSLTGCRATGRRGGMLSGADSVTDAQALEVRNPNPNGRCGPIMPGMTTDDIRALFEVQYQASRAQPDVPLLLRRERLLRMRKLIDERGPELAAAVQADFGMRSPRLTA